MKMKKVMALSLSSAMAISTTVYASPDTNQSVESTIDTNEKVLAVTSNILGLADTGNKSTLKQKLIKTGGPGDTSIYHYDNKGKRVKYENQDGEYELSPVRYQGSAVLDLGADSGNIDSSNAIVKLVDGSGYYADEFVLSDRAQNLLKDAKWENGKFTYTLEEGDLEWNTWDYFLTDYERDYNSSREWSMMGGDGNGVYYFNLEVSGIICDGVAVETAKIPVAVYIYGRSSADLGLSTEFVENTYNASYVSGLKNTDKVQWKWYTENKDSMDARQPYLNDSYTDYFSIVWPKGIDASGITANDVKVTLRSAYGEEYVLAEKNAYGENEYAVQSYAGETEVFVTYQQWAYVPVYSEMEITIDNGVVHESKTYDISSVSAYTVQTGGGGVTVDHTVTVYNYYGIGGMTLDNSANNEYTLSVDVDGVTYFYAEDGDGNGYIVEGIPTEGDFGMTSIEAPDAAKRYDGTDFYHIAVYKNAVFVETRLDNTEKKVVAGEEVNFEKNLSVTKSNEDMLADGAYLEKGYNLNGSKADKWAWTFRYQSGWTTESAKPSSLPYATAQIVPNPADGYPYGFGTDVAEEDRPYFGMEVSNNMGPMGPDGGMH
jgi:hypothetical protein